MIYLLIYAAIYLSIGVIIGAYMAYWYARYAHDWKETVGFVLMVMLLWPLAVLSIILECILGGDS